jgi:hypothetical protein
MSMSTGPSNSGAFFDDDGPAFTDDGAFAAVGFAPGLPGIFAVAGCAPGFVDADFAPGCVDDGFEPGRGAFDAVEPGSRFGGRGAFEDGREDFGDDAGRFFVGIWGAPSLA